jgi:hypothetical protein
LSGEFVQGLLHHRADVEIDLGHVGLFPEPRGDVDCGLGTGSHLAISGLARSALSTSCSDGTGISVTNVRENVMLL